MADAPPPRVRQLLEQGVALHHAGRPAEAETRFREALKADPRQFHALHLLGLVLAQRGEMAEAERCLGEAVKADSRSADALANWAVALRALGRPAEALAAYDRALALNPNDPGTHYNRGNALKDLERAGEALEAFGRATALDPRHANAFYNRGILQHAIGRPAEALRSFDAAIAADPRFTEAYYNRGVVLRELRRQAEAVASFEHAIAVEPDHADAFVNRGNALRDLGQWDAALASYDRAMALGRTDAALHHNRGLLLREIGRYREAAAAFEAALTQDSAHAESISQGFMVASEICDWPARARWRERLAQACRDGARIIPFSVLASWDSQEMQSDAARRYAAARYPLRATQLRRPAPKDERLRIAYVSADYRTHPTAFLMVDLIEAHDRAAFEIIGVSLAAPDDSPMRKRLEKSFDRLIDVAHLTDEAVARMIAEAGVSIAVDLGGYTKHGRPGIFVHRPAPLMASFLGYPGTLGTSACDYILADRWVIPEANRMQFDESIAYLPDSYQPNDGTRAASAKVTTRAAEGVPEDAFVFCCFNNTYKFSPEYFDLWVRLLHAVPGSVLWLYLNNDEARANLEREAKARGLDPARLVFAVYRAHEDHLARLPLADLFLDTCPYNAHTTASDALWAGVPVVTCPGDSFPARVAASLLSATGMEELIAPSLAAYEELALTLARDPARLAALKQKLARQRATCPLFDTDRFRRAIESAYRTMWEHHRRGLAPETFVVSAD